jgi:hypothetical protein
LRWINLGQAEYAACLGSCMTQSPLAFALRAAIDVVRSEGLSGPVNQVNLLAQ